MRLWSIHPKYLDKQGLGGAWREALLAKCVLENRTKGYTRHSQLIRFKETDNSLYYINLFLAEILFEAKKRNYKYDETKIDWNLIKEFKRKNKTKIPVTKEQVKYEFKHLLNKLKNRDIDRYYLFLETSNIEQNNVFNVVDGKIEKWEKIK
jgi:hypothetical protein